MKKNINLIQALLERHQYVVKVCLTDDGCILHLPERVENPAYQQFKGQFVMDQDGEFVKLITSAQGVDGGSIILSGPAYSHKYLIAFYLLKCSLKVNFSYDLIKFYIGQQHVKESQFLSGLTYTNMTEEEYKKESDLASLMMAAQKAEFPPYYQQMAEKQDILEGYKAIMTIVKGREKRDE